MTPSRASRRQADRRGAKSKARNHGATSDSLDPAARERAEQFRREGRTRFQGLIVAAVSLFLALYLWQTLTFPQAAYPEYAPNLFLLSVALGALAGFLYRSLSGDSAQTWLVTSIAGLLGWFLFVAGLGPGGTDLAVQFPSLIVQSAALFAVGAMFARWWLERDGSAEVLLTGATIATAALTFLITVDAFHQAFVRMPEQVAILQEEIAVAEANGAAATIDAGPVAAEARRLLHAVATGRVSGRFGNPNLLAAILCVLWPMLAVGGLATKPKWVRLSAIGVGGILVPAAIWMTASRGGLLTFAFAAGCVGLISWRHGLLRRYVLLLAIIVAGFVAGQLLDAATPRPELASGASARPSDAPSADVELAEDGRAARGSTISQRLGFLTVGAAMLHDVLPWGAGTGGYTRLFFQYQPPRQQTSKFAHSWPLQVLVEQGVPGLLLFGLAGLLVLAAGTRTTWRRESGDVFESPKHALVAGAGVVSFATFLANGCVEISFYDVQVAVIAWLFAGLALGTASIRATSTNDAPMASSWEPGLSTSVAGIAVIVLAGLGLPLGALSAIGSYGDLDRERDWMYAAATISDLAAVEHEPRDEFAAVFVGHFLEAQDTLSLLEAVADGGQHHLTPLIHAHYLLERLVFHHGLLDRVPAVLAARIRETMKASPMASELPRTVDDWRASPLIVQARYLAQRAHVLDASAPHDESAFISGTSLGVDAAPYLGAHDPIWARIDDLLLDAMDRAPNQAMTIREVADVYASLDEAFFEARPERRGIVVELGARADEVDYELSN